MQHTHPPRTANSEGLIGFGDGQRRFIAELQASCLAEVGRSVAMSFGNGDVRWRRLGRRVAAVARVAQEACIGHPCAKRKQPRHQDHPGGKARRAAVNGHIGRANSRGGSRLHPLAAAALIHRKNLGREMPLG